MEYLNEQLNDIKPKRRKNKRRTHTTTRASSEGRAMRIAKRNRVLLARWYYWTECRRLRSDDAIARLCDEFFVEQRTVENAIISEDAYFRQLLSSKATTKDLGKEYDTYNWA